MEAGNRCYDDRVPEEVNRRVIDHCSTVLMPYTERSRANLLREGIAGRPHLRHRQPDQGGHRLRSMPRSARAARPRGTRSPARRVTFSSTMHRAENVDIESRLRDLVEALRRLHQTLRTAGDLLVSSAHAVEGRGVWGGRDLCQVSVSWSRSASSTSFGWNSRPSVRCRTAAPFRRKPACSACPTSPSAT